MLATYSPERLAHLDRFELSDRLEQGQIIHFPQCPFELPTPAEQALLRNPLRTDSRLKNLSYHPEVDKIRGLRVPPPIRLRIERTFRLQRLRTNAFLRSVLPTFASDWREGSLSFRPMQERGRKLSPHASNELIHIDAGAYGATHGGRILRFFVNLHPSEARVWASKGNLPQLLHRWGAEAGVLPAQVDADYLDPGLADLLYSSLVGLVAKLVPQARMIDSSPYDRAMRRLHNFMKDTLAFQQDPDGYQQFHFAPGSAWMVLTDTVSHACLSGQYAFVSTNIVPLHRCRFPELAPINVLRRGADALARELAKPVMDAGRDRDRSTAEDGSPADDNYCHNGR